MLDQAVPAFSLPATSGKTCSLADFRGRLLALYFYPKDSTPGCTTEAQDFRDLYPAFEKLDCAVLGVPDPALAHTNAGRGMLRRLLIGQPLRALLTDDDLVITAGLAAPRFDAGSGGR